MKKRAFLRYRKDGDLIAGSLVITTNGSFPSGQGIWKEVSTNICCATPVNTITCIEIDVTPTNDDPDRFSDVFIRSFVFTDTTSQVLVYWGDGAISGYDMYDDGTTSFGLNANHKYDEVNKTYTIRACFSSIENTKDFTFETLDPYYVTEIRGVKKFSALDQLDLDFQNFSFIDLSGMNSLTELDLSDNILLSSVNFGSGLPNLEKLFLDKCAFTGSFNATIFPSLQLINVGNNTNLTGLDISGLVNLTIVVASNCALTQDQVDDILIELDTNGLTDGIVVLNGGTNATPSALGLAAAASLLLKNWTVTLN
jgi:hypothetical protein